MKRVVQLATAFAAWSLSIAVPLIWDKVSGGVLADWSRHSLGLDPLLALVALGGAIAVTLGFALAAMDRRWAWAEWRRAFRYAGSARHLDIEAIAGAVRPMGQEYVSAPRALRRPTQDPATSHGGSAMVCDDAEAHFAELVEKGVLGALVQGRSLVGKTRLVAEWLRSRRPDMFVVVLDPSRPVPPAPSVLRKHVGGGLCVWIDDLDTHAANIRTFLSELGGYKAEVARRDAPLIVLATVRDGAPSLAIERDPAFRPLREGLDRVELVPPTAEHLDAVVEATGTQPSGAGPAERSFAFLLGREFDVQRSRYRALTDGNDTERAAARLLMTARVLDERLVDSAGDRLRRAAGALFSVEGEGVRDAMGVLRREGFAEGNSFEVAYLMHVVPDPVRDDEPLAKRLEEHLLKEGDTHALVNWATHLGWREKYDDALRLLDVAVEDGQKTGTPEALRMCAVARMNGGNFLLWRSDDPSDEESLRRAREYWDEAERLGDASESEGGRFTASIAAFDRANSYGWAGDHSRAEAEYRHVIAREVADLERDLPSDASELAARAASRLGDLLCEIPGREAEGKPWMRRAVEWGHRVGTPMGLVAVARAEVALSKTAVDPAPGLVRAGLAGIESGVPDGLELAAGAFTRLGDRARSTVSIEEVLQMYQAAATLGLEAGTASGAGWAAEAALNTAEVTAQDDQGGIEGNTKALIEWRKSRPDADEVPRGAWRVAASAGRKAGGTGGLRIAATALFYLGLSEQLRGHHEAALDLYQEAAEAGQSSGDSGAAETAAKAESNRAALFHMHTEHTRAFDAWERARDLGRESGTEGGLAVAASCGLCIAGALSDAGDELAATAAYETVIRDGDGNEMALARFSVAAAMRELGVLLREVHPGRARALLAQAAQEGRSMGSPDSLALTAGAECDLARVWAAGGDSEEAMRAARRALHAAQGSEDDDLTGDVEALLDAIAEAGDADGPALGHGT